MNLDSKLPFIIDDDDLPQMLRSTVDSMLARANASPAPMPVAGTVAAVPPASAGGGQTCPGCGANVQGKDFCTSCGRKEGAASIARSLFLGHLTPGDARGGRDHGRDARSNEWWPVLRWLRCGLERGSGVL